MRSILALPVEEALRDRGASHPSILDIFVHVLDGYRFFFLGIIDHRPESEYEPMLGKVSLDRLQALELEVDRTIMDKITSLKDSDLDKITLDSFDLKSVLNHMIEEELQHRGELNALFWQMNVNPPISDLADAKFINKHLHNEKCEMCEGTITE